MGNGKGRGGKGEREGCGTAGDHLPYFLPTGFCLKYHPERPDQSATESHKRYSNITVHALTDILQQDIQESYICTSAIGQTEHRSVNTYKSILVS